MTDYTYFGQMVRSFRESKGISLREMAKRIDFSPTTCSQVERGMMKPTDRFLASLEIEMGIPWVTLRAWMCQSEYPEFEHKVRK